MSYDGLTDPLGQSQILPYILGLVSAGYEFVIISVEKKDRYKKHHTAIDNFIHNKAIDWFPITYHQKPPILSTCYNLFVMRSKIKKILRFRGIDFIHCRSYLTALLALQFKKRHGTKYLFDMRGFWADERIEGGIWPMKFPYDWIYKFFKKKEKELMVNADQTVVLTQMAKDIILDRIVKNHKPPGITVIPCCVDSDLFSLSGKDSLFINQVKDKLGFEGKGPILNYVGSLGTWYMLEEMLKFFKCFKHHFPQAFFLIVTIDGSEELDRMIEENSLDKNSIATIAGSREQMPSLISLADYSIFFIKPTFSKQASSPTKQGEIMCMGIPIITNSGIGDTDLIMEESNSGILIEGFNRKNYENAVKLIKRNTFDPADIRSHGLKHFDLRASVNKYKGVYRKILNS